MRIFNQEKEESKENKNKFLDVKLLLDKKNPEMITQLYDTEIDKIKNLYVLSKKIDEKRKELFKEDNGSILGQVVNSTLVFKTSIEGWRAKQIENIYSELRKEIEQEVKETNEMKNIIKKVTN